MQMKGNYTSVNGWYFSNSINKMNFTWNVKYVNSRVKDRSRMSNNRLEADNKWNMILAVAHVVSLILIVLCSMNSLEYYYQMREGRWNKMRNTEKNIKECLISLFLVLKKWSANEKFNFLRENFSFAYSNSCRPTRNYMSLLSYPFKM